MIANIDEQIANPANAVNSAKLNELIARQTKLKDELDKLYTDWEELSEQTENLTNG